MPFVAAPFLPVAASAPEIPGSVSCNADSLACASVPPQVDRRIENVIDGRDHPRRRLVCPLKLNQVGGLFIQRYTRNTVALGLELRHDQRGSVLFRGAIGHIASDSKNQAGVK